MRTTTNMKYAVSITLTEDDIEFLRKMAQNAGSVSAAVRHLIHAERSKEQEVGDGR